jgi:hypothetical protein
MKLISIYEKNSIIYCEFNDELNINGKTIKIDIDEINNNNYIKNSISPENLLTIGYIHGKNYFTKEKYVIMDNYISQQKIILKNCYEELSISYDELIGDIELMEKIEAKHLIGWLLTYYQSAFYKQINDISNNRNHKEVNNVINFHR